MTSPTATVYKHFCICVMSPAATAYKSFCTCLMSPAATVYKSFCTCETRPAATVYRSFCTCMTSPAATVYKSFCTCVTRPAAIVIPPTLSMNRPSSLISLYSSIQIGWDISSSTTAFELRVRHRGCRLMTSPELLFN